MTGARCEDGAGRTHRGPIQVVHIGVSAACAAVFLRVAHSCVLASQALRKIRTALRSDWAIRGKVLGYLVLAVDCR